MENRPFYLTSNQTTYKLIGKDRLNSQYKNFPITVKFMTIYKTNCFFVVSFNMTLFNTQARAYEFFLPNSLEIDIESILKEYHLGIIFSQEDIPDKIILYPRYQNSNVFVKLNLETLDFDSLVLNDYTRDLKLEGFSIMIDNIKSSYDEKNESIKSMVEQRLDSINRIVDSFKISFSEFQGASKLAGQPFSKETELIEKLKLDVSKISTIQEEHSQANIKLQELLQALKLKFETLEAENHKLREKVCLLEKNETLKLNRNIPSTNDSRLDGALLTIESLSSKLNELLEETAQLKSQLKQKDLETTEINELRLNYLNMSEKLSRLDLLLSNNQVYSAKTQYEKNPSKFEIPQSKNVDELTKSFSYPKEEFISHNVSNLNAIKENSEEEALINSIVYDQNINESKIEEYSFSKIENLEPTNPDNVSFLNQIPSDPDPEQIDNSSSDHITILIDINESYFAIGRKDGKIALRSKTENDKEFYFLEKHKKEVTCLMFYSKLVSGSRDETLKIWNSTDVNEAPLTIKIFSEISSLQYLEKSYFCCSSESKISILDLTDGKVINVLNVNSEIKDILFLRNYLIVATDYIKLWQVNDVKNVVSINKSYGENKYTSLLLLSSSTFLAGSINGVVEKWNFVNGSDLAMKREILVTNNGNEVTRMHLLNTETVACCSNKNTATIMNIDKMTSDGTYEDMEWYKGIAKVNQGFKGVYEQKSTRNWSLY